MKDMFSCTLEGKNWWKPFLGYIAILVYIQVQLVVIKQAYPAMTDTNTMLLSLAEILVTTIVAAVFAILLMRIAIPTISIKGQHFSFAGTISEYVTIHLTGILLTVLTLGIYYPWYLRRITDYLAAQTSLGGSAFSFRGTGGKLFKYLFLAVFLPLLVWIILFAGIMYTISLTAYGPEALPLFISAGIVYFAIFIILAPGFYLLYKWYVHFEWKGQTIVWDTEFWPSVGVVAKEIALTVITLGIYWPAMAIKLYQYFLGKTVIRSEQTETGRFSFDGTAREGFGFLWGQVLLAIVTLGIYLPWAYANIMRWFVCKVGLTAEQLSLGE